MSLEYLSGINPNIENILDVSPTSFSVEATGQDSTIFLWYYSFDLPENSRDVATGDLSKMDLMIQLDTLLTDYSLKYFEQVFTENQIYGPMLIWVRNKADILQASAIISNLRYYGIRSFKSRCFLCHLCRKTWKKFSINERKFTEISWSRLFFY